jgi:membrane-associated phospholipid phosphatase
MKKMNLYQTLIIILFFIVNQSFAQNDTIKYIEKSGTASPWVFVIPSALVSYGIITQFSPALQAFNHSINEKVSQNIHKRYIFDDYIQYAPYAGIYMPELFGIKAKHSLIDRTLVLATSTIICTGAVQIPKHLTKIIRPDGSNKQSFPSGHTATAFIGAHILLREYKETAPWIGIAGYGVAATTGIMRVINRKHWFSDVIAGAGVGIISVELSYLMLPVWHKLFKIDDKNNRLIVNPLVNKNSLGIGVILVF